jgi:nitrite reductase/ring-hydroxylating ferredoxin subunit
MAHRERVIGNARELRDGGDGVRFVVRGAAGELPAFAIRHRGVIYAYLNVCAHQQAELDWLPGVFFDADGRTLVCSLHGANYDPDTGRCVAGPCIGATLTRVPITVEADGAIVVRESTSTHRDAHG